MEFQDLIIPFKVFSDFPILSVRWCQVDKENNQSLF